MHFLYSTRSLIITLIFFFFSNLLFAQHQEHSLRSSYAGQEAQVIKSLSPDEIEGLKNGSGTPFGGMAKPAELNGYPGPRHVLDAYEAGKFELSEGQLKKTRSLFEEMKRQAIPLGKQIIITEKKIDDNFTAGTIKSKVLKDLIAESAKLYSELRYVHLNTHLAMIEILTEEQIKSYNSLRGYSLADPCENIPEGHNPEMWKKHNNCN